jgi:hypothetical protein
MLNGLLYYRLTRFPYKSADVFKSVMFVDVCTEFHENGLINVL